MAGGDTPGVTPCGDTHTHTPPTLSPGSTGASLRVQRPLELSALRRELEGVLARGIRSLAVLLLHSYA